MNESFVKRSATLHLDAAPTEVFPLFTPLGEYHWIPGWQPDLIYPPTGEAMTNNVFATQHEGQAQTIWLTVDYDPAALHAEYVNVTPGSHVERVEIQCRPTDAGTDAEVSYIRIAISEAGGAAVAQLNEAAYTTRMDGWQRAINHYLRHHTLIPAH